MKIGEDKIKKFFGLKYLLAKINLKLCLIILLINFIIIRNSDTVNYVNRGFLDNLVDKFQIKLNNINKLENFLDQLKQLKNELAVDAHSKITNDLVTFKEKMKEMNANSTNTNTEEMKYLSDNLINKENHQTSKIDNVVGHKVDNNFNIIEIRQKLKTNKRTKKEESHLNLLISNQNLSPEQ